MRRLWRSAAWRTEALPRCSTVYYISVRGSLCFFVSNVDIFLPPPQSAGFWTYAHLCTAHNSWSLCRQRTLCECNQWSCTQIVSGKNFFLRVILFSHPPLSFLSFACCFFFLWRRKKMPTVRSLWDARKERNFEISFIVNANEQNTIFIDFFFRSCCCRFLNKYFISFLQVWWCV